VVRGNLGRADTALMPLERTDRANGRHRHTRGMRSANGLCDADDNSPEARDVGANRPACAASVSAAWRQQAQ
jgi:hypothetical protein